MALTPKQQRFVEEYLVSLNATDAARKVGYAHPDVQGPRLLGNVRVASAIAAGLAKQQQRTEITADMVRHGLHTEALWHGEDGSASARVSAWRELGKLMGFYPAEGLNLGGGVVLKTVRGVDEEQALGSPSSNGHAGKSRL